MSHLRCIRQFFKLDPKVESMDRALVDKLLRLWSLKEKERITEGSLKGFLAEMQKADTQVRSFSCCSSGPAVPARMHRKSGLRLPCSDIFCVTTFGKCLQAKATPSKPAKKRNAPTVRFGSLHGSHPWP